jgi:hypothetical protein
VGLIEGRDVHEQIPALRGGGSGSLAGVGQFAKPGYICQVCGIRSSVQVTDSAGRLVGPECSPEALAMLSEPQPGDRPMLPPRSPDRVIFGEGAPKVHKAFALSEGLPD